MLSSSSAFVRRTRRRARRHRCVQHRAIEQHFMVGGRMETIVRGVVGEPVPAGGVYASRDPTAALR